MEPSNNPQLVAESVEYEQVMFDHLETSVHFGKNVASRRNLALELSSTCGTPCVDLCSVFATHMLFCLKPSCFI